MALDKDFQNYGAQYIDDDGKLKFAVFGRIKPDVINLVLWNSEMKSVEFKMSPILFTKFCLLIMGFLGKFPIDTPDQTHISDKQEMQAMD